MKISRIISIILALLFIVAVARLTRLENGGPPHAFVMLPGQEPATLYLPGPGYPFYTLFPKPEAQRPPAVVLIHGFTGDRVLMSGLARRLAENGYAVLAIDVNGHGENRNPFSGGAAASDSLRSNIKNAVDYLRDNQLADGSRIVVMGHSMGAGAALDYATHDPSIKGAVMISGGWALGPEAPQGRAVHFCRARSAGADPGHVHGAGGSSGGGRADRSRQDLRRLHAGQRGRGDTDAGARSHDDRQFARGRDRYRKMARQHIWHRADRADRGQGCAARLGAIRAFDLRDPAGAARTRLRSDGAELGRRIGRDRAHGWAC